MNKSQNLPFSLNIEQHIPNPVLRGSFTAVRPAIEKLLSLKSLNSRYSKIEDLHKVDPVKFIDACFEELKIKYNYNFDQLQNIPKTGPVLIVANHPFGGLEGIIIAHMLLKVRPDVKIVANYILQRITELRDLFISVDPFGGNDSFKKNIAPIRQSINWLNNDGCVCIFPSGAVSHYDVKSKHVKDPEWSSTISRIVRKSNTPVVPVFFDGQNSNLFQALGTIHPLLRTAMIPRELYNKRGKTIDLKIGKLIAHDKLASYKCNTEMVKYMRLKTYILGKQQEENAVSKPKANLFKSNKLERIAATQDPAIVESEITSLPKSQTLIENKDFIVLHAQQKQIPVTMLEIGRLREEAFRLVNEGTGKQRDLDKFDNYYTHLFVWHKTDKQIVGAYRLARTDKVIKAHGKHGLYTSTLFSYKRKLLEQMGASLELGRSFVAPNYQKNYSSLLLLWKGIGQYVVKHPQYRNLFGTVSINSEYNSVSRQLIIDFLRANRFLPELAKKVKPKNPMPNVAINGVDTETRNTVIRELEDISDLLDDLKSTHKQIPVLLKQYLKLGGKLLGFNIDPDFGDVLDGLIYVDLRETNDKLLDRFMTPAGRAIFKNYHLDNSQPFDRIA